MIELAEVNEHELTNMDLSEKIIINSSEGDKPNVFTDIYRDDTNIAIWRRQLSDELSLSINEILKVNTRLKISEVVTASNVHSTLYKLLGETNAVMTLSDDITLLVDMFCCLFELKGVGLRLTALDSAMCPRFHFDRIPCRLVTTYHGIATEWLPNHLVNRSKLGAGNGGKSDEKSGLFQYIKDVRQLSQGDVALLKGEYWHNNEGAGLVHRSPAQPVSAISEPRLLLTLDFITE